MRYRFVILAVLLLLFPCQYCSAEDEDRLLITAVCPTDSEGFALTNFSSHDVALDGYTVSDGEGTVSFTDVKIGSHSTLYVLSREPEPWMGLSSYIVDGNGVTFNRFILNDNGDDIHLLRGMERIDSFLYGDVGATDGWEGDPFPKVAKKHIAMRVSVVDTDSSKDWRSVVPGRTDMDLFSEGYDSMVSPFVFPDSKGEPIRYALEQARRQVSISIYIMTSESIVSKLYTLLGRGVDVRILVEGSPVGGMSEAQDEVLRSLAYKGADVRVMTSMEGYRRYTYDHSKYCVIDDSITVITSENWTDASFTGNRGWGILIDSEDVASFYRTVFDDDFNGGSDIKRIEGRKGKGPGTVSYDAKGVEWYPASVIPVISPDNSWNAMRMMMSAAQERIYSQHLDVSYDWMSSTDNPLSWMRREGIDCRLMIDSTYDSREDDDVKDSFAIMDALDGDVILVKVSGGLRVHNKGVIVDDTVWIGSVNWTDNSFFNNREAAVIVSSVDVAEFFASCFLHDWGSVGLSDSVLEISYPAGIQADRPFMMSIVPSMGKDVTVTWYVDDDIVREGNRIALRLPEGRHTVTVRAIYEDESAETAVLLDVQGGPVLPDIPHGYYVAIAICICVLLRGVYRRLRGRHDREGVQTGRF